MKEITETNGKKFVKKEAGRVNEEEIRKRIEVLEIRENGYLEAGNTRQANKIRNEKYIIKSNL